MSRKKQLRTTVLLLLIIIGCVGSGLYLRSRNQNITALTAATPISQEIDMTLKQYDSRGDQEKAKLQTAAAPGGRLKAELVFLGLGNEELIGNLLSELKQSNITATFYVTGSDAMSYPKSLLKVSNSSQSIGVAYASNASSASTTVGKRAVTDFIRTSAAIQSITGVRPVQALALIQPDDEFLAAAYACSIGTVVVPTEVVTPNQLQPSPPIQEIVKGLSRGSILCVRLGALTPSAADFFTQLCAALIETDITLRAKSLLEAAYTPAQDVRRVYTTERAVAFTFSGLGNQAELNGVLHALKDLDGTGTFFVTRRDLIDYPEQIRSILREGHDLGIAVQTARYSTATALLHELLSTQEELRMAFSYAGDLPVRPVSGSSTELLRQACGAGGFTLPSAMVNAVKAEDMRKTNPADVLLERFPEKEGILQRGEIVHFQMKQYQYSDTMLGELVKLVAKERNIYSLKPVMEVLHNREYTYTYPVAKSTILPEVKDAIYPGQLKGIPLDAIIARYIGIDWVNSTSFLPGFTLQEVGKLDKKGIVANDQNMIFLTFDDWGTDASITPLLDVLKAHHAKATFFVRTENVIYNPNLLRAIAMEGHLIGSHTRTHLPLSNDLGTGRKFSELTNTQVAELSQDLVASYQDLQSIVGDIKIDGRPALSKLFRPPTLAVSKSGLITVLDCGFTYSISGSVTTHDYKAKNAKSLADTLKRYSKSGAIFILHMSDTSIYTAEALDLYLTEMESRFSGNAYRFVSLSEVLK